MAFIKLHFLDARGELTNIQDWLQTRLIETHAKTASLLRLQPIDVVVQTGKHVIREKGHLGYAPKPGVVFITVDPCNPALEANVGASLERMFAHELHHAARWDGPGYGSTLGEALVSEGLAGHFVLELLGGSAEPWEQLPESEIRTHVPLAAQEWESAHYNHEAWFFGSDDLPPWLGYSLGFRLVAQFLSDHPGSRPSNLVGIDARYFRSTLSLV